MYAYPPRHGTHPPTAARKSGARLRRLVGVLAAVTCGLLASAAIVPAAAFARVVPPPGGEGGTTGVAPVPVHLPPLPPGWNKHPPLPDPARIHAVLPGGMPGWQIVLIAAGAAVLAVTLVVLLTRARAARRRAAANPA